MDSFLKKGAVFFLVIAGFACVTSLYAQSVRSPAPEFSMYQYEDQTFDTDTVYGKKVVTFVFGSIT